MGGSSDASCRFHKGPLDIEWEAMSENRIDPLRLRIDTRS